MASQSRTFKLTAVVTVAALGYLVGCGTEGNNTGFTEGPIGIAAGGGGVGPVPPGPTTGINVQATGTPVVNTGFPVTVGSGLTNSNMLPVADVTGASNAPTRLAMGNFAALGGLRPVVVQGNGQGPGQGRVVILARNPGTPAGTGNLFLNPLTVVPAAAPAITITDPFGILIDGTSIYITDQFRSASAGRVLKISNIQASGAADISQIGAGNLGNPCCIIKDTTGAAPLNNVLYVASYNAQGGVGKISRIDLNNTNNATNTDVLIQNVNFPSSMVMDISGGRRLLYVAENGNGSVSGAQGGVVRVDLSTFVLPAGGAGGSLTTAGNPSTGVTFVGTGTDPAYSNPYDLAIDGFGNVVISEGFSQLTDLNTVDTPPNQGRIRVIAKSTGVPVTPINSKLVLTGLTACRGISTAAADTTGDAVTTFFTAGASITTTLRQLTFRVSDGAIYKHIQLDSGKLNPLGTLFDAGDTALGVIANVKYAVTFLNSANGAVVDVR